jgi:hypothetical protein
MKPFQIKVRCIQPAHPSDPLGYLLQVGEVYHAEGDDVAYDNYLIHFPNHEPTLFNKARFQLVKK